MNLNTNKRTESFDIDNDKGIFKLFNDFVNDVFKNASEGFKTTHAEVDPSFHATFDAPEHIRNQKGWGRVTKAKEGFIEIDEEKPARNISLEDFI